jgi:hypothetical protein
MSGDRAGPHDDRAIHLKRALAFQWALTVLLLAACVAVTLVAACHSQFALALIFVGVTLFWAIPTGQKLLRRRMVPRAEVAEGATTLRPGRSVDVLAAVMMSVGLVSGTAWAVLGVAGTVTFPFGTRNLLGYVVFGGGWALCCAAYLGTMVRHRGTAYLRFTQADFVLAEGFHTGRGGWSEVTAVNDDTPIYTVGMGPFTRKRAQPYARCAITITKTNGDMAAVPDGNLYAANGNALRDWVRFYWEHPEYRGELADERGLARLHSWVPTAS